MDKLNLPADSPIRRPAPRADRAARALDPYGLDSDQLPPADLVSDLARLIAAAERHGLRPARAARWRSQLLTTACPPGLLTRCEQRLRGWLLRRLEQTAR
jgi:hypothetical protein